MSTVDVEEQRKDILESLAQSIAEVLAKPVFPWYSTTYPAACLEYLKSHRRLPGSERTMRLSKKRHKKVMRWYLAQDRMPKEA